MNFGEHNVSKTRKDMASNSAKVERKAFATFMRVFFICFVAVALVGIFLAAGVIKGIIDGTPDISQVNIVPSGYATFVYDADGNQMQKLTAPNSNRMSVSIDKIPMDLQHAVVAVEDERFYEHNGIDIKGIIRAAFVGVSNGFKFSEGASTITQQLLKNNVFTDWTKETGLQSVKRKIQEQYLAVKLEEKINDKQVILENYLNTINLGAGTYGVQAASQKYFHKDVQDLTLSESTVIAGITQNPSRYNPINHPDENANRRETVLTRMVKQEYISEEQKQEVLADDVYTRIAAVQNEATQENTVYSYFIDELTKQVVSDLQNKKGYTEAQAYQALYSGGLRIYTTQNPQIQQICNEEYQNPENFPANTQYGIDWAMSLTKADGNTMHFSKEMLAAYFKEVEDPEFDLLFPSEEDAQNHINAYKATLIGEGDEILAERCTFVAQPQSSMTIIDQLTGYVKAIVGGRGVKTASLTLNRATDTPEQPGSTFKILSTYAPALDKDGMTLATIYDDAPYNYVDGTPVRNATNSYGGDTTIRDAIIRSVNVVAVECLTDITPTLGLEYLKKFGFTTLSDTHDNYQPLALGGIYNGVTNLELTAAFAAIANNGNYIKPIFYTKILDQNGETVLDNTPETTRVIKESTAYLLTNAMEDVINDPSGTGNSLKLNNMSAAGKTGTTTDYKDIWFAGYTPYYTCAVWAGFDNNEMLPAEGNYHEYHKTLWQKVMSRVHAELPAKTFDAPASVEEVSICTETGKLANWLCPKAKEYFSLDTAPVEKCTRHVIRFWPTEEEDDEGTEGNATPTPEPTPPPESPGNNEEDDNGGGNATEPPAPEPTPPPETPGNTEADDNGGGANVPEEQSIDETGE